jgi:hypothetical protein
MNSDDQEKPQWKFDPNTGQPVGPDPQPPVPDPPSAQPSTGWTEQAPYQPQAPTPPQEYAPTPPPTQPYGYTPPQPPTQPYGYPAQPPTQPTYGQYGTPPPQVTPPTETPKRGSRAPLIIGVIAVALLLGIGGGALFLWQNVFNRPSVTVERLLPANTLGYFSFDPVLEGQQKAAMDKIREAFEAQPGFKETWERMMTDSASALSTTDCDEETQRGTPGVGNLDVLATYLGNTVTLAVLAPDSADLERLEDAANNGETDAIGDVVGKNVVAIIDLDFNPLNKKGPISDLKEQTQNIGQTELVEKYRDVEIRKFTPKTCNEGAETQDLYFALLDGSSTAVAGVQPEPLRVLIDGFRDNKTLKDDATFKALSGQVPQDRIAALYFNLTEIYKQAQLAAPELMEGQSVQNLSGAVLLTLSAANDGLQVDVASETDLSLMDTTVQVNPDARPNQATLNDVPSDALGFYVGTDLKTTLQAVLDALRGGSTGGDIDAQIQSFEESMGIDVEQDLIPLLGGDYAVSVSIDPQQESPSVVAQLKLTEPDKMKDLLGKVMGQNGSAQTMELAGGTFYGDEFSGTLLGVAQDRFWFIFDFDSQAAQARLQNTIDNLGKGFGTSNQWNAAKAHLARDSNAIAYVDLVALREYVESTFVGVVVEQSDYDANIAPFVRPLKYFLVGSATQAAKNGQLSRNHTLMFLGIGK